MCVCVCCVLLTVLRSQTFGHFFAAAVAAVFFFSGLILFRLKTRNRLKKSGSYTQLQPKNGGGDLKFKLGIIIFTAIRTSLFHFIMHIRIKWVLFFSRCENSFGFNYFIFLCCSRREL